MGVSFTAISGVPFFCCLFLFSWYFFISSVQPIVLRSLANNLNFLLQNSWPNFHVFLQYVFLRFWTFHELKPPSSYFFFWIFAENPDSRAWARRVEQRAWHFHQRGEPRQQAGQPDHPGVGQGAARRRLPVEVAQGGANEGGDRAEERGRRSLRKVERRTCLRPHQGRPDGRTDGGAEETHQRYEGSSRLCLRMKPY